MLQQRLIRRTLGACGALSLVLVVTGASAKEKSTKTKTAKEKKPNACQVSYQAGLDHEHAGQLRDARESFQACAKMACGVYLDRKCAAEVTQLDTNIASVVPVLTDDSGAPIADVEVKVDGQVVCSKLDGRAVSIDPGVHEFSFSNDKSVLTTQKVMIVEGQRGPVSVSLHPGERVASNAPPPPVVVDPKPAAPPPAEERPSEPSTPSDNASAKASTEPVFTGDFRPKKTPLLTYVLGGVGVVGLGAGALLTYWGKKDNDALGTCAPGCPQSAVNHIRTLYTVADAAVGAGVVSLGVATYLYVKARTTLEPVQKAATLIDVAPLPSGGGFASVRGTF